MPRKYRKHHHAHKYDVTPEGGMTFGEIAKREKLSEPGARYIFLKAMRKLRRKVKNHPEWKESFRMFLEQS
jgi:hypothetical protein